VQTRGIRGGGPGLVLKTIVVTGVMGYTLHISEMFVVLICGAAVFGVLSLDVAHMDVRSRCS